MSGLAFLYVVETGWRENIALLATMCAEEGELSAAPGDTPTSFLTDSRAMANDSLDCHRAGGSRDLKNRGPNWLKSALVNGLGALVTGITTGVVLVAITIALPGFAIKNRLRTN